MQVKIGNKKIGEKNPVFVIAEGGINHNGQFQIAKKIVEKAADCGVDAVKFQTFNAKDLASEKSKFFKLFKKLELAENEFKELADISKSLGLIFLSTPFSNNAADLLEKNKILAYKISSGDLTNIPLIKHIAKKKKPIILSTGMSNMIEVKESVNVIKKIHDKIIILHSNSSYPSPENELNLKSITTLTKKFLYPIGYSDNGNNPLIPIIAASLGAKIIEKHFTINKKLSGPDHLLSSDPTEMKKIVDNIHLTEKTLGDGIKQCQKSELENKIQARRSITIIKNCKKGEIINLSKIDLKRPATGIEPKFLNKVIGKKSKRELKIDEALVWKDLY
jgi:N,N'-diacetyllegionaminate synthase